MPEHELDDDADVVVPDVKLAEPRTRVFVEGDEFYAEVGAVADALFERGAKGLGTEALQWLIGVTASRKNPYRARR